MTTKEQNSKSQKKIPPPVPVPPGLKRQPVQRSPEDIPVKAESKTKSPVGIGRWAHSASQRLGCSPVGIGGFILLVLILVAVIFYALNGQPLFPIKVQPQVSPQPPTDAVKDSIPSEPAFVVLGQHNDEIFTFNRGVNKVYAYNPKTLQERQIGSLAGFDSFLWHESGKIVLLSHAHNVLGGIYILDLTQPALESVLVTDRESAAHFPRNLRVDASLPLAWSEAGDAISFVAQDIQDNSESLFIFELTDNQLVYTPARNLDRISSVVWINGDTQLALVAISDGQEGRYLIERHGGGFTTWNID